MLWNIWKIWNLENVIQVNIGYGWIASLWFKLPVHIHASRCCFTLKCCNWKRPVVHFIWLAPRKQMILFFFAFVFWSGYISLRISTSKPRRTKHKCIQTDRGTVVVKNNPASLRPTEGDQVLWLWCLCSTLMPLLWIYGLWYHTNFKKKITDDKHYQRY